MSHPPRASASFCDWLESLRSRLFRVSSSSPAGGLSVAGSTCQGFVPLRGITACGRQRVCRSVLGLSSPLDVLPIARSAGFFAPAPRPGFSVQGFLPARSHAASSAAAAPLPFRASPADADLVDVATDASIGFEAFIHVQMRSLFLSLPSSDFVLLQVLRLSAMEEQPPPLMAFSAAPGLTPAVDLQRIARGEPGSSVSGLPTCSRFLDLPRTIPRRGPALPVTGSRSPPDGSGRCSARARARDLGAR